MISRRNTHHQTQKSPVQRFLFVLGMVFFLMYMALGLMLIFWKQLPLNITSTQRIGLGILLIVYAFFRFVRLIQKAK